MKELIIKYQSRSDKHNSPNKISYQQHGKSIIFKRIYSAFWMYYKKQMDIDYPRGFLSFTSHSNRSLTFFILQISNYQFITTFLIIIQIAELIVIRYFILMFGQNTNFPTKVQVEVLLTKMSKYYDLQKEKKSKEVINDQQHLATLVKRQNRNKQEESWLMIKIVNNLRLINSLPLLKSYSDILKQQSTFIAQPAKNQKQILGLLPYIMGIIYTAKPSGLDCIEQFKQIMQMIFGAESFRMTYERGNHIMMDLRSCFEPPNPSFTDVNQYVVLMCQRNKISLETLNKVGHNFSINDGKIKKDFVNQAQYNQKSPQKGPGKGQRGNINGNKSTQDCSPNKANIQNKINYSQKYPKQNESPQKSGASQNTSRGSNNLTNYKYNQPKTNPGQNTLKNPPSKTQSPSKHNQTGIKTYQYPASYVPSYQPNNPTSTQNPAHQSSYLTAYQSFNFQIPPPPPSNCNDIGGKNFKNEKDLESRLNKL